MTSSELIDKLSWAQLHPALWVFFWCLGIVTVIVVLYLMLVLLFNEKSKYEDAGVDYGALYLFPIITISCFISLIFTIPQTTIPTQTVDAIKHSAIETTKTTTIPIASAHNAQQTETSGTGNLIFLAVSSSENTNYRYTIKTPNGDFQLKNLKDEYGDFNNDDVYIHQGEDKNPALVVAQKQYVSPKVRQFIDTHTNNSGTWTTYTFNVPSNSVSTQSKFE